MLLPIYAYGHPVLRQKAKDIAADYPDLQTIFVNMWETMYHADGVGLAAPQVGLPIRLFMIDTNTIKEEGRKGQPGIKRAFINAQMVEEFGEKGGYEEGCLSIPDVRGEVTRLNKIRLRYLDENFQEQEEEFAGINARVIQHEYDHIEGILFTDLLGPLKKKLIAKKLSRISKGECAADYKMRFAK